MDYEKKYNEALGRAKKFEEKYGGGYAEYIFPELAESEDVRIRKWLVNYFKAAGKSWIHRDISPEQILAYLEKQKEQNPNHNTLPIEQQMEAAMIAIRGEMPSKSQEWSGDDEDNLHRVIRVLEDNDSDWKELSDWLKSLRPQPKQEWSEEDKEKIITISEIIEHCTTIPYSGGTLTLNKEYKKELLCFIKSLRPSWKPSKEQMEALHTAMYLEEMQFHGGLKDKLRDLYVQLKKL